MQTMACRFEEIGASPCCEPEAGPCAAALRPCDRLRGAAPKGQAARYAWRGDATVILWPDLSRCFIVYPALTRVLTFSRACDTGKEADFTCEKHQDISSGNLRGKNEWHSGGVGADQPRTLRERTPAVNAPRCDGSPMSLNSQ